MGTRVFVAALVVASLGASVFAVGFMGPPTAELKAGQWNFGYSYSYSRQDLDKVTAKWTDYYLNTDMEDPDIVSGSYKVTPEDTTTQRNYFVFGYGVNDQWEVYAQLGIADIKSDIKYEDGDVSGINLDNDFAWGIGTRITLAQQDNVAWGLSAQMNWIDTSIDDKGTDNDNGEGYIEEWTWKESTDIKATEILVAFGPTVDMGGWKLYGGPYWYYLSGDMEYKYSEAGYWDDGEVDTGEWVYYEKDKSDYDAASNFGGFVGAIFNLADNCKLTIEGQMHGDGWGAGSSIMFTF